MIDTAVWPGPEELEPATTTGTTTTATPCTTTCAVTPSETAGPFPSIALLTRSDVREDRPGLQLTLAIAVVNTDAACAAMTSASGTRPPSQ